VQKIHDIWWFGVLVVCVVSGSSVVHSCDAYTELEASYCQLQAKGAKLPSLDDFRRNTEKMQYLLLKRPAQQAGMALTKPAPHNQKTSNKQRPSATQNKPSSRANPTPKVVFDVQTAAPLPSQALVHTETVQSAERCALKGRAILCDQQRFTLIENRFNHELPADALVDSNRLILEKIPSQLTEQQKQRLLSRHYAVYVDKMLRIGLGGVTMSYSQFYYTWQTSTQQGQDPGARFTRMYEFLKLDKKRMAVDRRVDDVLPASLNQCMRISVAVWTCDKGRRNWVYARS